MFYLDNQMSSVQRQLNLYGFKCVIRGDDKGSFYHPKFIRGDWEAAKLIRRCAPQNQLNLAQWKLPEDGNKVEENSSAVNEMKSSANPSEKSMTIEENPMVPPSQFPMLSLAMAPKFNEWYWPPAAIAEQQRLLNQSLMQIFNTCDLSANLANPVVRAQMPVFTSLNHRMGFRYQQPVLYNAGVPVASAPVSQKSSSNSFSHVQVPVESATSAAVPRIDPDMFNNDYVGADSFEDLAFMSSDLQNFLNEIDDDNHAY